MWPLCNEAGGVECRGLIEPHVCGRAVPERRRQGFIDGRFQCDDFGIAKSLFLGIESLEVGDALLHPLDTAPPLSDS
jgi:hypothetical protein